MSVDKLVDSAQLETDLTSVANAIRTKGGTSSQLAFPSGFVSAINNIPTGGGSTLITKNISANGTYNASSDSADGYSQVTVAVPNSYSQSDEGKVVSNGALVAQTSDTVTQNDTYDTTLINSLTVNVSGGGGGDTFAEICNGTVNSYESDELIKIPQNTLRSNTTLTSIKIYNCQDIGSYGFGGFRGVAIALPSYKGNIYSEGYPFSGSTTLQKIDLGENVVRIYNNFLNGANKVDTLIIRKKTIPTLSNSSAFNNNVFKSGGTGGTIYIPKVLYDALGTGTNDYTSATNWSTVNGYGTVTWAKIEGSQYENYYADGTPIPTT